MAELLLINPRRRRRAARATSKRRTVRRRRNPIATKSTASPARRMMALKRNPIGIRRVSRRRRNPITLNGNVIMNEIKAAAIGGAGAVAMDVLMGYANAYLPANLQRTPGAIGLGDAVKVALTIAAGQLLSKPTRGLSQKMAIGALTCQARDMLASFVPTTMTMGYASPARIVRGTNRVGPLMNRMGAYQAPGAPTALLNAYQAPGGRSMILNGGTGARQREQLVR